MQVSDQLNRTLSFKKTPERIVSLVPSQTELLVDLGLQSKLVGVTKFCVHPESLRSETTVVGGTKTVHFDRISSLLPDIIVCNKEENTQEMVEELSRIAPVWVSDIYTVEDSLDMIRSMGELFSVSEKASEVIESIWTKVSDFSEFMKDKPFRKAAYLIWKEPYMAAGKNTFIDHLMSLNRFQNIFSEEPSRYPEIPLVRLREAEVILLSTEPYPFKEVIADRLSTELKREVLLVDGEFFSWYGSRLVGAFDYFKTLH